jgi:hypothetical protein
MIVGFVKLAGVVIYFDFIKDCQYIINENELIVKSTSIVNEQLLFQNLKNRKVRMQHGSSAFLIEY